LNDEINRIQLSDQLESNSCGKKSNEELENRLKFLYTLACGNEAAVDAKQLKRVKFCSMFASIFWMF
jgi:hypothetical protein